MGRVTERRKVIRIRDGAISSRPDSLVTEEPLEIRLNGRPLAITMRTPGDDFALAAGFLVSEGVLAQHSDLHNIVYCANDTPPRSSPPSPHPPPSPSTSPPKPTSPSSAFSAATP